MQTFIKTSIAALALLSTSASLADTCPNNYTLYTPTSMSIDNLLVTYKDTAPYFGMTMNFGGNNLFNKLISQQLQSDSSFCINQGQHTINFPPDTNVFKYRKSSHGFDVNSDYFSISFNMHNRALDVTHIHAGSDLLREMGRPNIKALVLKGHLRFQAQN